ncbi:MAG: hypothetical protein IKW30_10180 [Lachnospiraceae bacterium]|nr:hypothetical protein [Lachnospiraceae bacterium]
MKNSCKYSENNIVKILLFLGIIILGIVFIYVNLVQYKLGLNSDIAAEGLLAKVIWESKQWLPEEWYLSSEAKVIGVTNLAPLFYGLTDSMCLAMGLACSIGILLIIWSLIILCKELNYSTNQKLLFLFLILLLPNNKAQLELLYVFAGYYVFHTVLYFITLAIYLKMLKRKEISKYYVTVVLFLHFLMGMQGVRGILMLTGPMLAVEIVRRVYLLWCGQKWSIEENRITGLVVLLNIIQFLGSRIPISVGYPLSRNIRKAPQKLLEVVLPDFINAFSWGNISFPEKIAWGIGLVIVVYLTIIVVYKGLQKKEIRQEEWVFLNFVVSVVLTVAALVFTTVGSSSRYFAVIFFAIAMGIVGLWKNEKKWIKGILIGIVLIVTIGNSSRIYIPWMTDKSYKNSGYAQIGEYLVSEGYEYAYTTFDHANIMTVINDGKIQVSSVASLENMEICKWLTSNQWYVPNVPERSKTAYIVSEYNMKEFREFLREHADVQFKTQIDMFHIYGADMNYSRVTE